MDRQLLVIGGAGGIGLALVQALVARGDSVMVTVLNDAERDRVEEHAPGVKDVVQLDLSNADKVLATLKPYVSSLARPLDGVALCAAIGPIGPAETAPLQQFRNIFEINVISQLAVFQATIESLRQTQGRILFLSSILGRIAMPFFASYCAAKFALEALGDIIRREVAPWNVDVILAEPGGVRTAMTRDQLRWSTERLEALEEPERRLYGPLYRGHQHMAEAGESMASEPEAIAAVLVQALTVKKPDTRYLIGADANGFLDIYKPLDDRGRDNFVTELFGMHQPSQA